MTLDEIEVKRGCSLSDKRSKGKSKGKNKTNIRAKPVQSEEEHYTTCGDRKLSEFLGRAEVVPEHLGCSRSTPR